MKLYDYFESGNAYKVRLALAQLEQSCQRIEVDILKGETRTPEFLSRSPNGRVPVLELDDGSCLCESNAILFYLARESPLWPESALDQARVLQWMFFEQYSHEPFIATVRFWHFAGLAEKKRSEIEARMPRGYEALGVMEQHLARRDFFAADRYTIADIALYAYTHVADEGGFELARFPALGAWLERVRAQPRHVPITVSARSGAL